MGNTLCATGYVKLASARLHNCLFLFWLFLPFFLSIGCSNRKKVLWLADTVCVGGKGRGEACVRV